MTDERFNYNYKTGMICDNYSDWQCTSNMRHIERRMNDLHYENVKLLKENEQLKQRITELEKEVNSLSDGEADWLIDEML